MKHRRQRQLRLYTVTQEIRYVRRFQVLATSEEWARQAEPRGSVEAHPAGLMGTFVRLESEYAGWDFPGWYPLPGDK